jgi:hypothetical protein
MDARRESEPSAMKNLTTVERKSEREIVVTRTSANHVMFSAPSLYYVLQGRGGPVKGFAGESTVLQTETHIGRV